MSAVTKVFIVLLVVCSLLLTAAVVVFVQRQEDYRTLAQDEKGRRQVAESERLDAQNAEQAARALIVANELAHQNKVGQLATQITTVTQKRDELQTQLDASQKSVAAAEARLTAQIKTNEAALAALKIVEEQLKTTRETNATITLQKGQVDAEIARLLKQEQLLIEQLRLLKEEVADLRERNRKLETQAVVPVAGPGPSVAGRDIRGVVVEPREFNFQYWATISVGSVDRVEKGMTFEVISNGTYMGTLKVETVEPNEAFGRLEGPKVGEIRKGMEVRSRLSPS